jgi:hypothetical protein
MRHVARAKQIVAKQRARIVRLADARCSTVDAEQTRAFASTLRIFEDHERQLGEELRQSVPRGSTPLAVFA